MQHGARFSDSFLECAPKDWPLAEKISTLTSMPHLMENESDALAPFLPSPQEFPDSDIRDCIQDVKYRLINSLIHEGGLACDEAAECPSEESFEASASIALRSAGKAFRFLSFKNKDQENIPVEEILKDRSASNVESVSIDGGSFSLPRSASALLSKIQILEEKKRGLIDYKSTAALYEELVAEGLDCFGAKGARLRALKLVLGTIDASLLPAQLWRNGVVIPEFRLVSTDNFRESLTGKPLAELCKADYEWVRERKMVIVRSSAVYSEDGTSLGAGIYDSIVLPYDPSLQDLVDAEARVYASMNTERAIRHRATMGVSDESMGLVLHEIDPRCSYNVYSHLRCHAPHIRDVVFQKVSFFGKDGMPSVYSSAPVVVTNRDVRSGLFFRHFDYPHYLVLPMDRTREIHNYQVEGAASLAEFVDLITGARNQVEMTIMESRREALVQLRPLPPPWLEPVRVTFPPAEECLLTGTCVGAYNGSLEVLGDNEDNCKREGFVLLAPVYMGSDHLNWIEQRIPAEGVVYLTTNSEHMRGHIESRCLERGVCIIMDEDEEGNSSTLNRVLRYMMAENGLRHSNQPYIVAPGAKGVKIRIISDGMRCALLPE